MKKIDGNWRLTKAALDGQTITSALNNMPLNASYNLYAFGQDAGTINYGAPGELDISIHQGPNEGKTYKAIYAVSPDQSEMTICYDSAEGDRPTAFLSPKGKNLLLATFKKIGDI